MSDIDDLQSDEVFGFGMELALYDDEASPPGLVTVKKLLSIEGPEFTIDDVDSTHHGSPGRVDENIGGRRRWGQITATCSLVPGNETHQLIMRLRASQKRIPIRKSYPDSPQTHNYWTARVASVSDSTPIDGKLDLTFVLSISGDIRATLFPT